MLFFNVSIVIVKVLVIFLKLSLVKGAIYEFFAESDEVFEVCSSTPNSNGMNDIFDLSDFVIENREGKLFCHGNATIIWDIEPSDHVQLRGEILKYQRGTWQPTQISMVVKDLCKEFYKDDAIWYKGWTHAIHESDRLCLNAKGHVFHHYPFNIDTKLNMITFVEGRIKIVLNIEVFDDNNTQKLPTTCIEVPGEMIKHRA